MFAEFIHNFTHNLFKPLLLFFYAGFSIPLLRVNFEFPKVIYQGLTIYLLLAIGWHGGEELASLPPSMYGQAFGFMLLGFCTNTLIGLVTYFVLRKCTRLRKVDAATVSGYYGSDSAGTFVTCLGVLQAGNILFAPYMPVMLAVMEIPGCLVALAIVSRLRQKGMDKYGNMPGEDGYEAVTVRKAQSINVTEEMEEELVGAGASVQKAVGSGHSKTMSRSSGSSNRLGSGGKNPGEHSYEEEEIAEEAALMHSHTKPNKGGLLDPAVLHEVFLNPGIFLLFAGIAIGFISRLQGEKVVMAGDEVFNKLFQGMLCLFLLEMGMAASQRLKDLRKAGLPFVLFALIAPNVFACTGMCLAHAYSALLHQPFEIGTYVLFAVLCGAASYIAVPAVQRLAIPEASPTLPLAASLGVTFSYNVTVGIPVYIMVATMLTKYLPVATAAATTLAK